MLFDTQLPYSHQPSLRRRTGGSRAATIAGVSAAARYPELYQFLGGSLHQDWTLDAATADEAVEQAIAETAPSQLPVIAAQIDDLLASHPADSELRDAVGGLCEYLPSGDGTTDRDWLRVVLARLPRTQ